MISLEMVKSISPSFAYNSSPSNLKFEVRLIDGRKEVALWNIHEYTLIYDLIYGLDTLKEKIIVTTNRILSQLTLKLYHFKLERFGASPHYPDLVTLEKIRFIRSTKILHNYPLIWQVKVVLFDGKILFIPIGDADYTFLDDVINNQMKNIIIASYKITRSMLTDLFKNQTHHTNHRQQRMNSPIHP